MRVLLIAIIFMQVVHSSGQDNWQSIISARHDSNPNISTSLFQIGKLAQTNHISANLKAKSMDMNVRSNGHMYIEIMNKRVDQRFGDFNIEANELFELQATFKNYVGGWILPANLLDLSNELPNNYLMQAANRYTSDHEGVTATNAIAYKMNGANGQGIKIAIIDLGFDSLSFAQSNGTAPLNPITYDHTGSGDPFESGVKHGTGCTECCYELADQASYYLHKISGPTQYAAAVLQAIADDVDIISASLTYYNEGWADGSGPVCAAVKLATDEGIIFVTSSGNRQQDHWQGNFIDVSNNDFHEWAGDEKNDFKVKANAKATIHLQWPGAPSNINNFDLFLLNANTGNILASSVSINDFESITWENPTNDTVDLQFVVKRENSTKTQFEVFMPKGFGFEYIVSAGSTASPSNSLEELCLSIGAIDWADYGDANPPVESFSSLGPTNGGQIVPDLCAPDGVVLATAPNGFFGTSGSTPITAGFIAVLWSEHDYLGPYGILEVVNGLADLYNDFGDVGKDNSYGVGAIEMPNYTANTRFIYKESTNNTGISFLPYKSMEQGSLNAPLNTNLFFIGNTFDAPILGQEVFSRAMVFNSFEKDAIIK